LGSIPGLHKSLKIPYPASLVNSGQHPLLEREKAWHGSHGIGPICDNAAKTAPELRELRRKEDDERGDRRRMTQNETGKDVKNRERDKRTE
jgi:hypothetical protein